jgi:hypothetical protein
LLRSASFRDRQRSINLTFPLAPGQSADIRNGSSGTGCRFTPRGLTNKA